MAPQQHKAKWLYVLCRLPLLALCTRAMHEHYFTQPRATGHSRRLIEPGLLPTFYYVRSPRDCTLYL